MSINKDVVYNLRLRSNGFTSKMGALSSQAEGFNSRVMGIKRTLKGLAVGYGAIQGIQYIYNLTSKFEKSMSNVKALTRGTSDEMEKLRKKAISASSTSVFTASEAADAQGYLAMAGFNPDEINMALGSTLDLAAAGGLDLARSADIASNVLSQYRMEAWQTARVTDVLAELQATHNTNVEQAADAFNYLGPTAAAMNISLEESAAIIGVMADNGLQGSLGTRALGSSLTRLSKPTKQMQEVMSKYNLEFHDAQGNFRGIIPMVEMLQQRLGGLSQKQRDAALSTMFGAEAFQEMNILLATGGEGLRGYTAELENAAGAAKEMADVKLDNLSGQLTKLNSTWESFMLTVSEGNGSIGSGLKGAISSIDNTLQEDLIAEQVGMTWGDRWQGIDSERELTEMRVERQTQNKVIDKMNPKIEKLLNEGKFDAVQSVIDKMQSNIRSKMADHYADVENEDKWEADFIGSWENFYKLQSEQIGELQAKLDGAKNGKVFEKKGNNAVNGKTDITPTTGGKSSVSESIDTVEGRAGKVINITIGKLQDNINISSEGFEESTGVMTDKVTQALLRAINNVNTMA